MTGQLSGQLAIVTGAAQGIGLSVAEHLARDGATIAMADIQLEKAQLEAGRLSAAGLNVRAFPVDVSSPKSCELLASQVVDNFGSIDILVNNAGLDAPSGSAWDIDEDHWNRLVDVNLSGQWWA